MPETKLYVRVKQALNWLKRNKGILQKDIANKMGITETSFTRGMARIKEKNDEDFVITFHSVVSDFISLDYLLTGNGEMILQKEKADSTQNYVPSAMSPMEFTIIVEKAVEKAVSSYKKTIEVLEEQLKDKKEIIKLQKQRIEELESKQQVYESQEILERHPFPIGVADAGNNNKEQAHV